MQFNTPMRRYERNSKLSKADWFARKRSIQGSRQRDALERATHRCLFCKHWDITLSETEFCDIDMQFGNVCEEYDRRIER